MAIRTMVAIFTRPDPEDPFPVADQVGTGSLIGEESVLVHPPFSLELAAGIPSGNLSVCIASWNTQPVATDVVEVGGVVYSVSQESAEAGMRVDARVRHQPLVELRLVRATTILPDPPLENLEDALRLLADPFNGPATKGGGDSDPNWFCKNLHIFC